MKVLNNIMIVSFFSITVFSCGGGSGSNWTDTEKQARSILNRASGAYTVLNIAERTRSGQTKSLKKKSRAEETIEGSCSLGGSYRYKTDFTPETAEKYEILSLKQIFTACNYNTQNENNDWLKNANFLEGITFVRLTSGINLLFNPKGLELIQLEYDYNISGRYNENFTQKTVDFADIFSTKKDALFPINIEFDTLINTLHFDGAIYIKIEELDDFTKKIIFSIDHEVVDGYTITGSDNSGIEMKNMDFSETTYYNEKEDRFQDKDIKYSEIVMTVDQTIIGKNNAGNYKIETIKALRTYPTNINASSGEVNIYSSEDNALVKLFVIDSNNIKLSVDLDNDGSIEYTETMKWSEF
jgi:hypothetical protein